MIITKIKLGEVYMDEIEKMAIIFPNQTKKYLLPCLKEYGKEFMTKLNGVFKIAAGIGDVVADTCGLQLGAHIFLQVESTITIKGNRQIITKPFMQYLDWIRKQPMYETDYVFGNIQNTAYHMIVLKFPEKYSQAFKEFREGNYSRMFDKITINRLFHAYPHTTKILIRDSTYIIRYVHRVNAREGTTLTVADFKDSGELDFKPEDKDEIFNHNLRLRP